MGLTLSQGLGPVLPVELTAARRRIVEHDGGPLRVSGGAGSGKTTALVARYLRLVDKGHRPSSILVACADRAAGHPFPERRPAAAVGRVRRPAHHHLVVEYLQLLDESDDDLGEAHLTDSDAVKVMTIHQAKGLEFDVVYCRDWLGGGRRASSPTSGRARTP